MKLVISNDCRAWNERFIAEANTWRVLDLISPEVQRRDNVRFRLILRFHALTLAMNRSFQALQSLEVTNFRMSVMLDIAFELFQCRRIGLVRCHECSEVSTQQASIV